MIDFIVVDTLIDFLDAVKGRECLTTPDTQDIYDRLLKDFHLVYSIEPIYLSGLLSYITALWASENLTVSQLGSIQWATDQLRKLD